MNVMLAIVGWAGFEFGCLLIAVAASQTLTTPSMRLYDIMPWWGSLAAIGLFLGMAIPMTGIGFGMFYMAYRSLLSLFGVSN